MKSRKTKTPLGVVLFISLISIGCTHHPEYPEQWQAPIVEQECPNISGVYQDIAKGSNVHSGFKQYGSPDNYIYSLYSMLFLGESKLTKNIDYVRIQQASKDLQFEVYKGDAVLAFAVISYDPDECKHGFLKIKQPKTDGATTKSILAYTSESYNLAKSPDNSLILRSSSKGIGIYVIPFVASQWMWYRFSKWED